MSLLSITLILFFILDPLGKVGFVTRYLSGFPNPRRILVRELVIALAFMFLFNFVGELIFWMLKVSETTVKLSSGLILFLVAIKLLFPQMRSPEPKAEKEEPLLVPLAIPTFASPALLATIMLFAHMIPGQVEMLSAICISWGLTFAIMMLAKPLTKMIGSTGLMACERLMALLLVLLSIQRILDGIKTFVIDYTL